MFVTAAAVSERKPGGSRGDVVHREQDHEPQHKQVFLQAGSFSRRCFLTQCTGWAPQQRLTALQSSRHLGVDVCGGSAVSGKSD